MPGQSEAHFALPLLCVAGTVCQHQCCGRQYWQAHDRCCNCSALETVPTACRLQTLPLCLWMSPPQVRRHTPSQSNAQLCRVGSCAKQLLAAVCVLSCPPRQALSTFHMLKGGPFACRARCQVCWHSHAGCEEHCANRPHRGKRSSQ